ncbi:MAG: tetratricopeptide repeat protein [Candidatus Obscuribacterales bacterium]|nr:tetratricopeptide repeat protein [Candidatus Obscuribacterales bacterium]
MKENAETMTEEKQKNPEHANVANNMDKPIPTAWGYRGFVLVSATFIIFELIFVTLYSSTSWFDTDIRYLGIPVVILLLPITHQILLSFERKLLLKIASPLRNGLPLVLYWNWLKLEEKCLSIGLRKVAYSTIDELKLTIWGNLHIRTRALRVGAEKADELGASREQTRIEPTDLIFKLPLGVVSPHFQKLFVETVQKANPEVMLNKRLKKRLAQQDISASQMVGVMGAAFLLIVLLDLGQASYTSLEVLKNYYLADLHARKHENAEAERCLQQGDRLIAGALPMSWIKTKFFDEGNGAAGVKIARAEALWQMDRREDAISECRNALKLSPKGFRINLRLARMLSAMGSAQEAKAEIEKAMEANKDSFLPNEYMMALELDASGADKARKLYDTYLKELDEEVFGEEPVWPPGGERMIHNVWYREDLTFLFQRLFKQLKRS